MKHYTPREIYYTRDSVIWVLERLQYDSYPPAPSSYTDVSSEIQKSRPTVDPNRTWNEIRAEIRRRLKMCGPDASLVILHYAYGVDCVELESLLHEKDIQRRISRAVNYISWGPDIKKAKRGSYKEWCKK